ncbi:MAG: pre-peptidase C-terminal domain-containing protein, partial [Planctomycetota bacterium]
VEAEKKNLCKIKVTADKSLHPGLYPVWLVTKTGVSNMRLLSIGVLPVATEAEPNNVDDQAQEIALGTTVEGVIDREDVDRFKVELKEGQRLSVEIEAIRLYFSPNNQNIPDPYVAIVDANGFEVASSDDASLWMQDGFCSFVAPQAGTYQVLVRDSAFGGHPSNGYRLHLGDYPRPMAIIPGGGPPASTLLGTWVDSEGTPHDLNVELPAGPSDRFPIVVEDDRGPAPSPNFVRVSELPVAPEVEPNDRREEATAIPLPAAASGVLSKENDNDYFAVDAKKGTKYRVDVYARRVLRSKADVVLHIYDPKGRRIAGGDDANGTPDPYAEFTAAVDGKYSVRVLDHLRGGSPIHHYRIEITRADPIVEFTPKELRRDEPWRTVVPAGGHGVMVVRGTRRDFGGEIQLDLEGVPDGVETQTWPMPPGRIEIPVVFKAKADSTVGGNFITVGGTGDGYASKFRQQQKLVLGQNRRHMWDRITEQAVMCVAPRSPFEIEVLPPASPIVRQGNKDIRVRLKRDEDFKNTVYLRTAYNPPGIGINNGKRFEKDATEISIPISANGGAATGDWPLVFVVRYADKPGAIEIATNPVMLKVETQYFKFAFPKATGELGTETSLTVGVEILRDLPAEAEVEIVGLPKGVTSDAPIQTLAPDATSVTFPIKIAADAKPGNHKTIVCIGRVKTAGEPIVQTVGTGSIRVDKPLPAKKTESKPEKKSTPKPKAATQKPLSRLEQLRQQKTSGGN